MVIKNSTIVDSPIGKLLIVCNANLITTIQFYSKDTAISHQVANSPLLHQTQQQISNYFKNPQQHFNINIAPAGTTLQKCIWRACQNIDIGTTKTYSEIAQQVGTSPRVVGNALSKNPILLIIPCHRVVAKSGIGGFAGQTNGTKLDSKKWLLRHEQQI